MKKIYLLLYLLIMSCVGFSQTITITKLSKEKYCVGDTISVTFDAEGTFNAGNTFSFEVKKYTGSFVADSVILRTKISSATGSDTISFVVTGQIVNDSLMYRIISSAPFVKSDSLQFLSMYNNPPANFASAMSFCMNSPSIDLSLNSTTLTGTYSGTGVSNNILTPSIAGVGSHSLPCTVVDNSSGCSIIDTLKINVYANPPTPQVFFTSETVNTLPANAIMSVGDSVEWSTNLNFTPILYKGNNFVPGNIDTAGIYIYYEAESFNGCLSDSAVMVTVVFAPDTAKKKCNAVTPTVPTDSLVFAKICVGATQKLTCTAHSVNAIHDIVWFDGSNTSVANIVSTDSVFHFTKNSSVGIWSYFAFENDKTNNCYSPIGAEFDFTVNPNPQVSISIADTICYVSGFTIQLNVNPAKGILILTKAGSSKRITNDSLDLDSIGAYNKFTLNYTSVDSVTSCADSSKHTVYLDYAPYPSMPDLTVPLDSIPTLFAPARDSSYSIAWYNGPSDKSNGISPIFVGSSFTPPITTIGYYPYYVIQSDKYCSSNPVETNLTVINPTSVIQVEQSNLRMTSVSSNWLNFNRSVQGKFSVFSILGVKVLSDNISGNAISIHSLQTGIYILELTDNGSGYSFKFIKE